MVLTLKVVLVVISFCLQRRGFFFPQSMAANCFYVHITADIVGVIVPICFFLLDPFLSLFLAL